MKVLSEGHLYLLEPFEGGSSQEVQFIEKVKDPSKSDGSMITINDGTTNEEVLRMLINRMKYLQAKFPCRENAIVITKLEESLMWLDHRTAGRQIRGVEGMHKA